MKIIFTLAISLLACHLTFAQVIKKGILFELNTNSKLKMEEEEPKTKAILSAKNISSNLESIDISALEKYLNEDNSGFEQLLCTFNMESDKLYLTLRPANRSTLEVSPLAFSSSSNLPIKINPTHNQNFINKKGGLSKSNGFVLEKSAVLDMLKKMSVTAKKIKLKAIHTNNSSTQEDFLNVLFISTPETERTFSTFNVEAGMMGPEDNTGCPPFNCND